MDAWDLDAELAALRASGLHRQLRRVDARGPGEVDVDGRAALLFCSNDYLGLAGDPEVIAAAKRAAAKFGAGSGSSRLISGHASIHAELESTLAAWKGCERALVFSTGYQANLGVLQALVGEGDVILSDELNHASLIDGCRLSRATVRVYRHADLDGLETLLRDTRGAGRRLIVTDSVFSMDGDCAPLEAICALAESEGARVMVDEAHATGVFGASGSGLVEALGLGERVFVQMGTLGKALGSFGAYVAGSAALIDLLVNRARTFVFTTGLPPASVAAAAAAIGIVQRDPERRERLWGHARRLREGLAANGFTVPAEVTSPILPVRIGSAESTMAICEDLLDGGVFIQGIRPPTVPEGSSRLRLTPMATHSDDQIDIVLAAFQRAGERLP